MIEKRRGDAGLSLIEVIVSLAIFAMIGIAGLGVLNTVARTGERTEGRLERLAEIDRAFLVARRDLFQIMPGDVELAGNALSFRRADGERAIALAYLLEGTTLTRRIVTASGGSVDQYLLAGIAGVQWRLLDGARQWHGEWPPVGAGSTARPLAAELSLDIEVEVSGPPRRVTRLVVLPAGQSR